MIALTEIVWRSIVAGFLFGNATQTLVQVDQRQEVLRKTYELYGQGKYREAIPLAQQLVELDQKDLGSEDPDMRLGTKIEGKCSNFLRDQ